MRHARTRPVIQSRPVNHGGCDEREQRRLAAAERVPYVLECEMERYAEHLRIVTIRGCRDEIDDLASERNRALLLRGVINTLTLYASRLAGCRHHDPFLPCKADKIFPFGCGALFASAPYDPSAAAARRCLTVVAEGYARRVKVVNYKIRFACILCRLIAPRTLAAS